MVCGFWTRTRRFDAMRYDVHSAVCTAGDWASLAQAHVMVLFAQPGGLQQRMKPWGYVSLVAYTIGLPLLFSSILYGNRLAIRADQELNAQHLGTTKDTNPHFQTRTRYQELYRCSAESMRSRTSCTVAFACLVWHSYSPRCCRVRCQSVSTRAVLVAPRPHCAQVLHRQCGSHVQLHAAVPSMVIPCHCDHPSCHVALATRAGWLCTVG
jgi:hypothetical protein